MIYQAWEPLKTVVLFVLESTVIDFTHGFYFIVLYCLLLDPSETWLNEAVRINFQLQQPIVGQVAKVPIVGQVAKVPMVGQVTKVIVITYCERHSVISDSLRLHGL